MKRLFIIWLLFFLSSELTAQNLSLPQILSLQKMNLAEIEEFLTAKGWEFRGAHQDDSIDFSEINFAYSSSDNNFSVLQIYSVGLLDKNVLELATSNQNKYTEYIEYLKSNGDNLENSYIKDKNLVKIYRDSETIYKITTASKEEATLGNVTLYLFSIVPNNPIFEEFLDSK